MSEHAAFSVTPQDSGGGSTYRSRALFVLTRQCSCQSWNCSPNQWKAHSLSQISSLYSNMQVHSFFREKTSFDTHSLWITKGTRCCLPGDGLCTGSRKGICCASPCWRGQVQTSTKDPVSSVVSRVCISDVREEGGLATLEELREKFGSEKVELQLNYHQKTRSQLIFAGHLCPMWCHQAWTVFKVGPMLIAPHYFIHL